MYPSLEDIRQAAHTIRAGGLVAFPTETVYGLGADAGNVEAVGRIFQAKGRPSTNPLIIHLADFDQISKVAEISPDQQKKLELLSIFWPGPLSVVLPKKPWVSDIVSAGRSSVALRIPRHQTALALIREAGCPIAAPSANPSGYISPTCAAHVADSLGHKVDMILDGGHCEVGLESTVLSLLDETACILRCGAVTQQQLEMQLKSEVRLFRKSELNSQTALSPGMLGIHYAPKTPLKLVTHQDPNRLPPRFGLIQFRQSNQFRFPFDSVYTSTLSKTGDLDEVARNIFAALREQDSLGLDLILIDVCAEDGLGMAIMDRLKRATIEQNE